LENFQNFKKISNNKKMPRVPPLDIFQNFKKISNNGLLKVATRWGLLCDCKIFVNLRLEL